jgi:hypothetical protein
MPRHVLVVAALILFGGFSAAAQAILPNSFAGWSASGKSAYTPANGVAASVAKEYDFVSGEHATYTLGGAMVDVTLFRMKDPSGAYGQYSYLRASDMPRADLAEHSAMSNVRALALVGNLVIEVRGNNLP